MRGLRGLRNGYLNQVLANRLRFIEIRVENDETAFGVFETLNARGGGSRSAPPTS